jgi:hypothetical protein
MILGGLNMVDIEVIRGFDECLHSKSLKFEAIVIGGTALKLLGIIQRETIDCDVLAPTIPTEVMQASKEFASDHPLLGRTDNDRTNWLNNGPDSLVNYLPSGWRQRLQRAYSGKALVLETLGRSDLIATKLLAYCDRGQDKVDLIDLKVTKDELLESLPWVQSYDSNPSWPDHVHSQFQELAESLGYEF